VGIASCYRLVRWRSEQEAPQHLGGRRRRAREAVLDARLEAGEAPALAQRERLARERGREIARVDEQRRASSGSIPRTRQLVERQLDLVGIERWKERDVVAARAQLAQAIARDRRARRAGRS
jgi:hypothetical protein